MQLIRRNGVIRVSVRHLEAFTVAIQESSQTLSFPSGLKTFPASSTCLDGFVLSVQCAQRVRQGLHDHPYPLSPSLTFIPREVIPRHIAVRRTRPLARRSHLIQHDLITPPAITNRSAHLSHPPLQSPLPNRLNQLAPGASGATPS